MSGTTQTSETDVLKWLLAGDPSVRWQTQRHLQGAGPKTWRRERERVAVHGWGARILEEQASDGTWGGGLYSPKWTSTTYSLILLRRLGLEPLHPAAVRGCEALVESGDSDDGGVDLSRGLNRSETCITGFVLGLITYFRLPSPRIEEIVDYLLREQMLDGGWNCLRYRGATHSSFHTTINVLEGLRIYAEAGGERTEEAEAAEERAREFFLRHALYRSHRTGEVVKAVFSRFSFPPRWHHDVLRTLDYFRDSGAPCDSRLEDPIGLLRRKRREDGRWPLQNRHPGRTYFEMEKAGEPSRWNTLRALRVLKWWAEVGGGAT
ncbi:hypothetical protein ACFL5A_00300 [Gemmatimonadota bacterium]